MSELFCIGDDDYKPNIGYVIGLDKNRLYVKPTERVAKQLDLFA